MRTQTDHSVTMTYPDEYVWTRDYNNISFEFPMPTYDKLQVELYLTNGVVGKSLIHTNRTGYISFDITDTLIALSEESGEETDITVTLYAQVDAIVLGFSSFHLKTNIGKTLAQHSHSSESVVYFSNASQIEEWQNFYLANASVYVNGTYLSGVTKGYDILDLSSYGGDEFELKIVYSSTVNTNDVYYGVKSGTTFIVKFIKLCGDVIEYRNSDGCLRYLIGKIVNISSTSTSTQYYRRKLLNKAPTSLTSSTQTNINFVCAPLEYSSYAGDITINDTVYINGVEGYVKDAEIELIPNTVTTDCEIEIIIQK